MSKSFYRKYYFQRTLFLIALFLLLFSLPSRAVNEESSGQANLIRRRDEQNIIFKDDFDDGSLDGWKTVHGKWQVVNGSMVQLSNYFTSDLIGGTYALTGFSNWTDYSVSARLMSKDNDKIGFVFRYVNPNNYYILSWQDQGKKIRFTRILNGKETNLAKKEIGYQRGKWYVLKVAVVGKEMSAYLGSKKVLSARDDGLPRGMAGFYCHGNEGSYFDNFTVREIEVVGTAWSDVDGDGTRDSLDKCGNTPPGTKVDEQGCQTADRIQMKEGEFRLESGRITVDSSWKEVKFSQNFTYPIVVAGPLSHNGVDPAAVVIKNISPAGFEIRIQEWPYLDGTHTEEILSYLAVERGHFALPTDLEIEADVISTDATGAIKPETPDQTQKINFFSPFSERPIVFTARVSAHGAHTVVTRGSYVTEKKFELIMQEEEGSNQEHVYESISYIALTPGRGKVEGRDFVSGRVQVSDQSSIVVSPSGKRFKIHIDEEGAIDEETNHSLESVGYLIFEDNPPLLIADMQTMKGFDPANLRYEEE